MYSSCGEFIDFLIGDDSAGVIIGAVFAVIIGLILMVLVGLTIVILVLRRRRRGSFSPKTEGIRHSINVCGS